MPPISYRKTNPLTSGLPSVGKRSCGPNRPYPSRNPKCWSKRLGFVALTAPCVLCLCYLDGHKQHGRPIGDVDDETNERPSDESDSSLSIAEQLGRPSLSYYGIACSVTHSMPQGAWTPLLITARVSPLLVSSTVMPVTGSTP